MSIVESKIISLPKKYNLNLSQTKLEYNPLDYINKNNLILIEQSTNRLSRFFLSLVIVFVSSILCFLLVKYSIDWVKFNIFL